MTDTEEHKEICFICNRAFHFGFHKYYGKFLPGLQLYVCETCIKANWDGLRPDLEQKLEDHLTANGLTLPKRNSKGLYPLA